MTEQEVLRALADMKDCGPVFHRYSGKEEYFAAQVRTGGSWFGNERLGVIDAVAIRKSWSNPCITFYEVKVSRRDFVGDEKWVTYLKYCHKFYFACPQGLIKPDEVQKQMGLVYVNDQGKAFTKKKALIRHVEMPWPLLYYVIMSKLEPDRDPFHASKLDRWRRWIEFVKEKKRLGIEIGGALGRRMHELEEEIEDLKIKNRTAMEVLEIMNSEGLRIWDLRNLIKNRHKVLPARLEPAMRTIAEYVAAEEAREGK